MGSDADHAAHSKLADSGQAILCTIHQPNAQLFNSFDALILLGRGGKTIYAGETGKDSKTVRLFASRAHLSRLSRFPAH
jgi:hypothetical protein